MPVSWSMLHQIITVTPSVLPSQYEATMVAAMFSLMFHAFLRVGEVTASPHNLDVNNVIITGSSVSITFISFKHHHGRPVTLNFSATNNMVCPVRCLRAFFQYRGTATGPVFKWLDGRPISSAYFTKALQNCVSRNPNCKAITPHSFRIGAASYAAASGKSGEQIQAMGRWKSDAFLKYIRIPSFNL